MSPALGFSSTPQQINTHKQVIEQPTVEPVTITYEEQDGRMQITYELNRYEKDLLLIDRQQYIQLTIPEESNTKMKGFPEVPNIRRSVIIDDTQRIRARVIESEKQVINNINIAPSKGILSRTINPQDVPYTFEQIYSMDTQFPKTLVELSDPYIIRDFRGITVNFNPFVYNPAQQTLEVYTTMTVELFTDGQDTINCLYREQQPTNVDTTFNELYDTHFLNYGEETRYTPVSEQGNMIVITYDSFWDEMVPFVQWKNQKGVPTEMFNVSEFGSANAILTFISNYYDDPGLTFVLLVGDIDQVPSLDYSGHAADPKYTYIVGSDNYQDLFIGRFSANNVNELNTQIERSIMYEKYPQQGAAWYHKGTGVASNQGPGDDGEYDDEHMDNIRDDLLAFTYTEVDQIYDPYATASMVSNALNEGRSIVNYCGHGSPTSWGSSGFSNSHINQLVNDNMLPFIVSVACNNGEFDHYTTCFAEAWMRATHNGEPTGAIGVFASTQSQSWDPPMDAQDEFVDLLCAESRTTYGALCFQGTMHMMDEYGSSCYDETNTWTVFGDPSLQVRTDTPIDLPIDHASTIMDGANSFAVTVDDVENALCALSYEGTLLGYGYTDENGDATITLEEPIADMTTVTLTITSFNADTYITTLDVISKRQPAEFELMEGTLIRYPFGISYDIIAELAEDDELVTIVTGPSQETTVRNLYSTHGVNLDHCSFLHAPTDTYWTRDYGPWFVFDVDGNLHVVDFNYNRPRPDDNAIPAAFANWKGLPLEDLGLTLTGGNYMTDGKGISVSTDLILSENPGYSEQEIKDIFSDILGISQYHIVPDALGEYIEHIDCWAKLLRPDTIMILEVPSYHPQYDELEAAVDYFEAQISSWGRPYTIERVYAPDGEAYINSLILNDKVLVPIEGSQWDDDAIASYEAAMPGYEVLGFTGSWASTDALHCRTKGIPEQDMIYIDHMPLTNGFPTDEGFLVEAGIFDYSDTGFVPGSVQVFYNIDDTFWTNVPMESLGDDAYQAYIPPAPSDATVSYYLSAENNAGELVEHPLMGMDDPHQFTVTPVPDIWIDPTSFDIDAPTQTIVDETLTVGNDEFAGQLLSFDVDYTDQSGLGWLTVFPLMGDLNPGETLELDVTIDTNPLAPGDYEEMITITSNDPDEPLLSIPVQLSVTYGDDTGAEELLNPPANFPSSSVTVEARISNYGAEDQTSVPVYCQIMEGLFQDFLEEDFTAGVPPPGWTQEQSGEWEQSSSSYAGGTSPEADLYWYDISGDYAYLQSSTVNTIGAPELTLEFRHFLDRYDYGGGDFSCRVLTRSNAGDSWTDVTPWSNPVGSDIGPELVTLDISSDIGTETQIRFEFDGYYFDIDDWYLDDVLITSNGGRDPGDVVYSSETQVDINGYSSVDVAFSPDWDAEMGIYAVQIWTELPGDEQPSNDLLTTVVTVEEAQDFILNLVDFPMYQALADPGYNEMCGPAAAKMTLDYIWWNSIQYPDGPEIVFDQQDLYTAGLENNTDPDLTYLDTQGLWYIIQNNKPEPYDEYGYNFMKFNNEDVNEVLKRICLYINYTIGTAGGYTPGHPEHVPALVPAYGDYSNWMAIRGIHTDKEAYPLQDDLVVYGFWINDPLPGGIGENSYKTLTQWLDTYYDPLTSNDQYNNKYVTILEPPEADYNHELLIAEQTPQFTQFQQYLLSRVKQRQGVLSSQLQSYIEDWVIQAAVKGANEELTPIDEDFEKLFSQVTAEQPLSVTSDEGDYYLVPFATEKGTQCVILIDAQDGSFLEASWTDTPLEYLPVSEDDMPVSYTHLRAHET